MPGIVLPSPEYAISNSLRPVVPPEPLFVGAWLRLNCKQVGPSAECIPGAIDMLCSTPHIWYPLQQHQYLVHDQPPHKFTSPDDATAGRALFGPR